MKQKFRPQLLIALCLILTLSSCSYMKESYQSSIDHINGPDFPLTAKAVNLLANPGPLFENKTRPEKISNALIVYPLALPFALGADVLSILAVPLAPLLAPLSVESANFGA